MRTHLYNNETLALAPNDVKMDYLRQGLNGTHCGYVGITTVLDWRVDCKRCLRIMRNNGKELTEEQINSLSKAYTRKEVVKQGLRKVGEIPPVGQLDANLGLDEKDKDVVEK